MFIRFNTLLLFAFLLLTGTSVVSAQEKTDQKDKSPNVKPPAVDLSKEGATAEQIAESVIIIYVNYKIINAHQFIAFGKFEF